MAFSSSLFDTSGDKSSRNESLLDNLKQQNEEESKGKRSIVIRSVPLDYDEASIWNMCSNYGKIKGLRCKEYPNFRMFFVDFFTTR